MPPKRAAATQTAKENAPAAKTATKKTKTTTTVTKKTTAKVAKKDEEEPKAAPKAAATKKTAAPKAAAKKAAAPKKTAAPKAAAKKAPAPKKAAAPKKTAAAKKAAAAKDDSDKENSVAGAKRKREEDEEEEEQEELADEKQVNGTRPMIKRAKTDEDEAAKPAPKKAKAAPKPKPEPKKKPLGKVINEAPTKVMDIFVFGEGTSGELGLGSLKYDGKKPIDVKRPRINHNLSGIVQVACGGMHVAALTKDNKILTWGVNDQGALGRDTTWDGGLRDADAESDSEDEDDTGLNPKESTPGEIDTTDVPEGTVWVQVVASDSATFALTATGQVYGWGTFRSNEGILGFTRNVLIQKTPALITQLSKIKQLAVGSNHVLALDEKNKVFAWGAGQQAQLARRLLERDENGALFPASIGTLPGRAKAAKLACGSYHCFIIDTKGRVIGWGLNNYAELGIEAEAGTDGGFILKPQLVDSLKEHNIVDIAGGEHHSLATNDKGELLTWGRIDGHQVGHPSGSFTEENTIFDEKDKPRILVQPAVVPDIEGKIVHVAAGTDHSFAITEDGKVYSWGFSANYQTGQGTTDDIETPTLIDNSAIRDRKIIFAGAGGQYSILGAEPKE
ncbi:hypothetical protein NEUTE1DRAFT_131894 [Neurospora tetrasperma FGSC 2508]|uniref:RCC1-like domain-containing protein n=1 Tax=Neurospora tetrasperma (strain FGSC 2508 / ATCC MYA-4615 / P0657) TaxID=510951 RepID=F8MX69_NEUT8|nr:uncharacterized protein NEUTE1DRAFT_131894 [Neurospora tetrasperma FGSC 2508]EGO54340.1 hypothetical protein NEUTE1DRAFT_131894 [Neurospora tetrasperma FGSC 2508]EGZ68221.1 RCC1/BLIP-II [Neurospora tetrasperma FGSC 2509]